jgi:hypothetical protein
MRAKIWIIAAFTLFQLGFSDGVFAQIKQDSAFQIYTRLPFHSQPDSIWVVVRDSFLIFEDDIIVGKVSDLHKFAQNADGDYCTGCGLWPNSTIPYTVAPGFSNFMVGQINFAIDYLNRYTNLCIVPRTNQANYVRFIPSGSCSSALGMNGGEQIIELSDGCAYGSVAHEILHAAGFFHEQSRNDRDLYVDIFWENIIEDKKHNFWLQGGIDQGNYDYVSIMHYHAYAFTINGQPTIKRKNGATDLIGNSNYLSGADIEGINLVYDSKCGTCLNRKVKISPHSMTHNNIGHWEIDGALLFQDNTAFVTNGSSVVEFDSGTFIDINPTATNTAPFEAVAGSQLEMSVDGCPGTVPTWYSFQSLNFPNRFIRHYNYTTQIDKIEDIYAGMPADANFKMVNAFDANCGDCVSFESKNYPNYYLVVEGGNGSRVRIAANGSVSNFAQKATFRLHSGFASAAGVTLESWFAPGHFINHNDYIIYIGPYVNDRVFRENATFRLTTGL